MKIGEKKIGVFLLFAAAAVAMAFSPLRALLQQGRPPDYYSHIPLVPAISAFFLFRQRKELLKGERSSLLAGVLIMVGGLGLIVIDRLLQNTLIGHAEICTSAAIVFMSGSFLVFFGHRAFAGTLFPFAFLLFAIPVPLIVMEKIVSALVAASVSMTSLLFRALQVPFSQEGPVFYLPGFGLEVAKECSGIRSTIALVVTVILASHLFLRGFWRKALLVLAVFPITVFKNGLRIVTLYLLSYYVDMRVIEGGFLHRSGGILFFFLGLILLGGVLRLLRGKPIAGSRDLE